VRDNWSMFFSSTLVAGSCSLLGLYIYIFIYLGRIMLSATI
jgi:hypothetical protein